MDPSESIDWYPSSLHIVEDDEGEIKQEEEPMSSVIANAFSGMVASDGMPTLADNSLPHTRPSVVQHTSGHIHHHNQHQQHGPTVIVASEARQRTPQPSVIVPNQNCTAPTTSSFYTTSAATFPNFSLHTTTNNSVSTSAPANTNFFLPPNFMSLSFPEFDSHIQYPALPQHPQFNAVDLFDTNQWMSNMLERKAETGTGRRPSFTEAIFPQMFGGHGLLDVAGSIHSNHHSNHKSDPLDSLYLSPSISTPSLTHSSSTPILPQSLSQSSLVNGTQAPPPTAPPLTSAPKISVHSELGYCRSEPTIIREAVLELEKPEDRDMVEQECQVCNATVANGLHFGARTCAACAAFFRRSVADDKNYACKGSQRCTSSAKDGTGYRKICRRCRYQRCVDVGMQPENVQHKRLRKGDTPGSLGDLVGKGTNASLESLFKMNFHQPILNMGQMPLATPSQLPNMHQSTPQQFYC